MSETIFNIRVIPRARKSEFAGERAGAIVIRLAAPPVDGAANAALIEFLAESLGIPRRDIRIVSGDRSRDKRVAIRGISEASGPSEYLRSRLSTPKRDLR